MGGGEEELKRLRGRVEETSRRSRVEESKNEMRMCKGRSLGDIKGVKAIEGEKESRTWRGGVKVSTSWR